MMIGFNYYLDNDIIKDYQKKPLKLRLKWLYQANKLRKYYSKDIIEKQDRFRCKDNY